MFSTLDVCPSESLPLAFLQPTNKLVVFRVGVGGGIFFQ